MDPKGDRNTKFFHRTANSHKRFNTIDNLLVEGELTSDPNSISTCISHFYKQLYSENEGQRPVLDEVEFSMIFEEEAAWLDGPFEEEEVYGVIQGCNGDKSPGLDGFSMAFFKACWDFLKLEIMEVLKNFNSQAVFEKSVNATFLALISKKVDDVNVRDFRPISLVGNIYKVISKLLANRLRRVITRIISVSQNVFVLDRQILESILIANECLDSRLKAGIPWVLCKLDVEKAFDHVSCDFLMYMLQHCGFFEKWRKWILFCISIVRFSILINGFPKDFFGSSRGLRQGDPLSLPLFAIVMEALSRLLDGAVLVEHISGFTIGTRSNTPLMVAHLLLVDDF